MRAAVSYAPPWEWHPVEDEEEGRELARQLAEREGRPYSVVATPDGHLWVCPRAALSLVQ